MSSPIRQLRVTPQQLFQKKQQGEKIVSLTAYDYGTARVLDESGVVDFLLVGDSLGMVVLGYPDTLSVTMEDMIHHTKAVARGTQHAMVVVDMPFMSVHTDFPSAVHNVGRMVQEGRAQAVKMEGASEFTITLIRHLVGIGIPVMGHLGFTPQSVHGLGGYKVQGRSLAAAQQLLQDARTLEQAGVFAMVLEMVPHEVATWVSRQLAIPTIGIGAGPGCDGQILVVDDFMGKYPDFKPRFARNYLSLKEDLRHAAERYAADVLSGEFPQTQLESFGFPDDQLAALHALPVTDPNTCLS